MIKIGLGFQEIDFPIKINRIDYDINQKFDIILKELLFLRQNKPILIDSQLKEIEIIVKSLKETIIDNLINNFSLIEKLRQTIENNKKLLEKNKNEIQNLKDEILNIKNKEKFSSLNKNEKQKETHEIKEEIKENNDINGKDVNNYENNNEHIIDEQIFNLEESYSIKKLDVPEKEQFTYSIIIDGAKKTGKTSIIEKFIGKDNCKIENDLNLGYQKYFKYIDINNTIIKLDIIDFSLGDIPKRAIMNYKNANIIVFVYSIDNYTSFQNVEDKLLLMKPKFKNIIFLVGNKNDLENREVIETDAINLGKECNISFFSEISAKTGNNIDIMFFKAVKILYQNIENEQKKIQYRKRIAYIKKNKKTIIGDGLK